MGTSSGRIQIKAFNPRIMLVREEHIPSKARYPVIDAHNHLLEDTGPEAMIGVMDEVGVQMFVNTTGNTSFIFEESGYTYTYRDIGYFIDSYVSKYPERFACFTMSDFAISQDGVLIKDNKFAERAVKHLENDVKKGACGLKVTKELGLRYRDSRGDIIPVDDPRLDPIWAKAGELRIPVLIHTSDPAAFFLPVDENNEHYLTLLKAPSWSFHGSRYSKEELLEQRDRLVSRHPGTTFICPHVANYPENLPYVSLFLDQHPNAMIDISARIDELGRQPYSSRKFLIKYADRILFGIDMPVRGDIYRSYFRFLETRDEYFDYPDYFGVFGNSRWGIYGVGLPDEVLKKIYHNNAKRVIPSFATEL
ncbi:MAG: amidohydrolase family protein [Spirochaetota bacterium]